MQRLGKNVVFVLLILISVISFTISKALAEEVSEEIATVSEELITNCADVPDGTICDDQNKCSLESVCKGGVCRAISYDKCNDDISCTLDHCDAKLGCIHTPFNTSCEQDSNTCAEMICDVEKGCVAELDNSEGNECYIWGLKECQAGICREGKCTKEIAEQGTACRDDGKFCTADLCNAEGKCEHKVQEGNQCDDSNPCTEEDVCKSDETKVAVCEGVQKDCGMFSDPCNEGQCNIKTGECVRKEFRNGTLCQGVEQPADECHTVAKCMRGECVMPKLLSRYCFIDGECFNNRESSLEDPCKLCNTLASTDEWSCKDDVKVGDSTCLDCKAVDCMPGEIRECSLGEFAVCMKGIQECSLGGQWLSCLNAPEVNGAPCDDGNLYTENDICSAGVCQGEQTYTAEKEREEDFE